MAFNSNVPRAEYIAATGQTVFPFVFKVFEQTDVKVYLTPAGQISDDSSDLLQTGYTVSINGDAGGSVIFSTPTVSGDKVTLLRSLPVVRNTDYQENGDLRASTLDSDQDYQTYLVGDLSSKVDKAVKFPESAQGLDGTLPSPSADNYIRWNSTGTALVNDTELPSAVQLAKDWANKAEDSIVADGEYSAKHYSLKAEDEKEEAATQAGIAVTKAGEASTSASQALGYRNEAEGFRDEAEGFALSINPDTIVANSIHEAVLKTTPIDTDEIGVVDSASTFTLKKITWANLKATLKTYFNTLYQATLVSGTNIKTINSASILGSGNLVVSAPDATNSVKGIDYKGLLAEYTVTGSAVTSIDFSGLDINTHKSYRVEIELVNASASYVGLRCFINGDTTLTNYYVQNISSNGTTVAASRSNVSLICEADASNAYVSGVANIIKANGAGTIYHTYARNYGVNTLYNSGICTKIGAISNITQLSFVASVTGAIGVGSKIRIYRGDV